MSDPSPSEPQDERVENGSTTVPTRIPQLTQMPPTNTAVHLRFSPPGKWNIEWQSRRQWSILGFTWTNSGECARPGLEERPDRLAFNDVSNFNATIDTTHTIETSWFQHTIATHWFSSQKIKVAVASLRVYHGNHLVLGIMNRRTGLPREIAIDDIDNDIDSLKSPSYSKSSRVHFFAAIRKGTKTLRPWWRRVLSLKSVSGFSVYECLPKQGYHVAVEIDDRTKAVLGELYREYVHSQHVPEKLALVQGWRWLNWTQETFNRGDTNDDEHCLALELILKWSVSKICIYGLTPVIFSLAIGFWFQYSQAGDHLAIVQTAWAISSFVIGASSSE